MLRKVSWVLLALVSVLTLLGALASAQLGYSGGEDQIGPVALAELAAGRPEVAQAIHGRRGTAAAYAAAFAVLLLFVVLVPYRRGEAWSWWAIAAATVVGSGLIVARVVFLPTTVGAGVGWTQLGVVAVALLLDAGRLRKR
jgi:hypothetical protein